MTKSGDGLQSITCLLVDIFMMRIGFELCPCEILFVIKKSNESFSLANFEDDRILLMNAYILYILL